MQNPVGNSVQHIYLASNMGLPGGGGGGGGGGLHVLQLPLSLASRQNWIKLPGRFWSTIFETDGPYCYVSKLCF